MDNNSNNNLFDNNTFNNNNTNYIYLTNISSTIDYENKSINSLLDNQTVIYVSYIFICVLVIMSLIAMLVNIVVFASIHWIRRPMPPILKMSLSLAAADASSSSMFAVTLFINTYLPTIGVNVKWLQVIIEMIRLSGILITVTHLLALSLNHYIGILKPLHYNSIVTRRKVTLVIILLWICPTLFIVCLFTFEADSVFWDEHFNNEFTTIENGNHTTFMDTFKFRITFSSFFFLPIVLMAISYTHILIIVRKQQNVWKNLSRGGSTKWSGRSVKKCTNSKVAKEQKQLEGNIRAIYTTLLILGSCVIGWLPALLVFVLMCEKDCYINGDELKYLNENYIYEVMSLRLLENMLIILKMLANPIIYSIRMKEIQESTKRMYLTITGLFCSSSQTDNSNYRLASKRSINNSCISSQRPHTKMSINTSQQTSNVSIGRLELVTTLL